MKKIFLYKVRNNKTETVYIGQTLNIKYRWMRHCNNAKHKSYNYALANAIRKYGRKNFSIKCLGFCLSERSANLAEIELITYWRSKCKTYNRSIGGENAGRWSRSEETRKKIRKSWTKERRNKLSKIMAKQRKDPSFNKKMYEKRFSKESKQKFSISIKKAWARKRSKPHQKFSSLYSKPTTRHSSKQTLQAN